MIFRVVWCVFFHVEVLKKMIKRECGMNVKFFLAAKKRNNPH